MSETPNPYGTPPSEPSGQPTPPSNPYGQQPPSNPYGGGQQPAGTPYGQPGYGAAQVGDPGKRPGTVTAAGIITIVLSALTALGALVLVVVTLAFREDFADAFDDNVDEQTRRELSDAGFTVDDLTDSVAVGFAVFLAVLLVWSLIAVVLGLLAMRGKNWARIMLVVSASVTALLSLVGAVAFLLPALNLIAAIAVIVLLFTGGASQWYAAKSSGGQQSDQPWGQAPTG